LLIECRKFVSREFRLEEDKITLWVLFLFIFSTVPPEYFEYPEEMAQLATLC
jgi:hypothetical protein